MRGLLKDDLGIFLYLKFRSYSFIFNNFPLYFVFERLCFCKRTCDKKESKEYYCNFCSRTYPQIFDDEYVFNDIIVDERDFISQFNIFFRGKSLFYLDICQTHLLRINTRKATIFGCTYPEDVKTPNKHFRVFLSILIRLYVSYFFPILKEVELNEEQAKCLWKQIWSYAASLLCDFCHHVDVNYFNLLLHYMKYPEDYKSNCFKIINKHFVVDLT